MGWAMGFKISSRVGNFSLCHHIQISSGDPPNFPSNEYQGIFSGVKWLGHEADHSPPSIAEVKKAS